MKLDINEVHFAKSAVDAITIKGSDARTVANLLDKFNKEFDRLKKLEEK